MGEQQNDPAQLGKRIADARKAKGMTQQGLADLVGVDRKTVNRWESGRTQGLGSNYAKLAEALGWSPRFVPEMLRGNVTLLTEGSSDAYAIGSMLHHQLADQVDELLGEQSPLKPAPRSAFEEFLRLLLKGAAAESVSVTTADDGVDLWYKDASGRVVAAQVKRPDVPDPSHFLMSDTIARVQRLLGPDSPLDPKTRETLTAAIWNACTLVDPIPRGAQQAVDDEQQQTFEDTVNAIMRRSSGGRL